MTVKARTASERWTFDEVLEALPGKRLWAEAVFARLNRVTRIPTGARVLDVGASSGGFVAACLQMGYRCDGVEPSEEARGNARRLGEHLRLPIHVVDGRAEAIPFDDGTFDVVHASSVIEHVPQVEGAISEIHRVLKPGGVFWFNAASAMSPFQEEIRWFPLFGWYPNSLKLRIMAWAKESWPELIGHTSVPAVNWFTPWSARALLRRHGFRRVYDRWDIRADVEGGALYRIALRTIRTSVVTKALADVALGGCSYAALK